MSGYHTYLHYQRLEERANKLGFRLAHPKHGGWPTEGRGLALIPMGDELPVYSRDAELFVGDFNSLEYWLAGWEKAQMYDQLLRITDEKKRKQAEGKERERQQKEKERLEKRKTFALLSDKTEAQIDKLVK